jgi:hypothetical protein
MTTTTKQRPKLPDPPPLPTTLEEWDALRATVRAKNSERAKRGWLTRRARQANH